jgi:hypothetical protein
LIDYKAGKCLERFQTAHGPAGPSVRTAGSPKTLSKADP